MASEQEVRRYLAYWFQLGKKVLMDYSSKAILPQPVIRGDRYSEEFEDCWRQIIAPNSGNCYLEGTQETVAQLLTPAWDLESCARCDMPLAVRSVGMPPLSCPCDDLSNWPNTEVPAPRSPVNSQAQLSNIRQRLLKTNSQN